MQGNKVRNHDLKRFFSMCVVAFFILTIAMVGTATAKSLYMVAEHHRSYFDAWNIKPDGTASGQTRYTLTYSTDPAGVALDVEYDAAGNVTAATLFVSSEFSGGVELVDAITMTPLGVSSGPSNLAGLAVDDANDIVYAVKRWSDDLYAYDWNPITKKLTLKSGYPINLPGCRGAFGIALDDKTGILWVADAVSPGVARAYNVGSWTEDTSMSFQPSHQPVDIEVDRKRGFVYTVSMSSGAWTPSGTGSYLISKYEVATGRETTVDIGHEGVGIAVDEVNGYVYVTGGYRSKTGVRDNLEVWDPSTWTRIQQTGDLGNPAGICIPKAVVAYNPLNLAKNDIVQGYGINIGETFTYEITYNNKDNAYDVTGTRAVDTLPAELDFVSERLNGVSGTGIYDPSTHTVTWDIGTLPARYTGGLIELVVRVNQSAVPGSTIYNYCTIESNETPPTTVEGKDPDNPDSGEPGTYIIPNQPPIADANGPYVGNEGSPVTFDASGSSDPDGDPLQYRWDFNNDGTWDTGWSSNPIASYTWNDDYSGTAKLEVNDGELTDTDTASVTVNNVAPTANADGPYTGSEGSTITFTGSAIDPGADTFEYRWDFDNDGTYDTPWSLDPSASYTWNDDYNGTVVLQVRDDDGGLDKDTASVTVLNVAPTVDAGVDQTVNEGAIVSLDSTTFNDPGTKDTHTATIDWGDGTAVEDGTVNQSEGTVSGSHVYADNGIYTVTVTVIDDDGDSDSDTLTVTVNNVAPTVDAGPDREVNEGNLVSLAPATFNDKGTLDTHTATIDWGDGSPVEVGVVSESPFGPPGDTAGANGTVAGSHVYGDNGVYTVTVTVEDDDGGIGNDALQITVLNVTPTVEAGDDQEITAGDYAEFEDTYSDPGWLDTHTAVWEFGDESTGDGAVTSDPLDPPNPVTGTVTGGHSYFKAGEYTVTLKVTDDDGDTGSDTLKLTVKSIAATIDFDPDTLNKKSGDKWVTVYIELPEGYDVWQIDGSTVLLNDIIPAHLGKQGWAKAESNESNIMDHDGDGILERMVKFDRNAVKELLEVGDEVQVTVTGGVEYDNGHDTGLADFKGQDVIRVIDPGKGPKAAPALVKGFSFAALSAYPQPCNPDTWIPYTLGKDVEVTITIYSSSGHIIRTLNLGHQVAGAYISKSRAAYWDGRNEYGEKVSSGIYFYTIKADDFIATRKMVVVR